MGITLAENFLGRMDTMMSNCLVYNLLQKKLHEITMQGSLSVVVVGLIRHELLSGEGIPFGAIFGSLQFSDISYLYSKEFAGTIRAKFAKKLSNYALSFSS